MSSTPLAVALAMAIPLPMAFAQPNSPTASAVNKTASGMVGWTWPDAQRSSWGIIWSCLSIFLVCSWKCVHLNVPTPEESRAGWHSFRLFGLKGWDVPYFPTWPLLRKWGRKVKWMAIICVAPEVGVALAVKQRLLAGRSLKDYDMEARGYTIAHAFYAHMGGIVLRTVRVPSVATTGPSQDPTACESPGRQTEASSSGPQPAPTMVIVDGDVAEAESVLSERAMPHTSTEESIAKLGDKPFIQCSVGGGEGTGVRESHLDSSSWRCRARTGLMLAFLQVTFFFPVSNLVSPRNTSGTEASRIVSPRYSPLFNPAGSSWRASRGCPVASPLPSWSWRPWPLSFALSSCMAFGGTNHTASKNGRPSS